MPLADQQFIQFSRQILLPEVGEAGQQRLMAARVAIVGIGGLGQLCAQYLSAAGIGGLTLIDDDKVELSNLPRQLLFSLDDCGKYKALVAQQKLGSGHYNADICQITAKTERLNRQNARTLFGDVDLVLDCSDNFATRHCVNAACVAANLPNVVGSAAHFSGQLMAFDLSRAPEAGCYHCVFPAELRVRENCSTLGVLGPMVGTMASMQALLALKLIMDLGGLGEMQRYNGLMAEMHKVRLRRDPHCPVCADMAKER
ncbi:HesA/MoeB/ThiF family protein [Shewanella sp.]|uniref:HesA/MoeB/ThiF family protein n=1 Tax=Shewanella sp. TaxID=50422 RepID=UPI003D12F1D1